jgi:uncharacterized RDD family membrane protein YckC
MIGLVKFKSKGSIRLLLFLVLFNLLITPLSFIYMIFAGIKYPFYIVLMILIFIINVFLILFMKDKLVVNPIMIEGSIYSVSKTKRLCNFVIDRFFIFYILLNSAIRIQSLSYENPNFFSEINSNSENNIFGLSLVLIAFFFYLIPEGFLQLTLGKIITKTIVVNTENVPISFSKAFKRTICRFIPFESLLFLFGKEVLHDSLTYTHVVDCEFDGNNHD